MAKRPDYATEASNQADGYNYTTEKPTRIVGTMTTRVLITEKEPLFAGGEGKTIGQMVDERIAIMTERPSNADPDWRAPAIHSITIELPTED